MDNKHFHWLSTKSEKNTYKHYILLTEQVVCVHGECEKKYVKKTWLYVGFELKTPSGQSNAIPLCQLDSR